jgi:hypothetical protein
VETYNELKEALLAGSHMEAVGYLGNCVNSEEIFPEGDSFILGFQISRFDVRRSGMLPHIDKPRPSGQ